MHYSATVAQAGSRIGAKHADNSSLYTMTSTRNAINTEYVHVPLDAYDRGKSNFRADDQIECMRSLSMDRMLLRCSPGRLELLVEFHDKFDLKNTVQQIIWRDVKPGRVTLSVRFVRGLEFELIDTDFAVAWSLVDS